MLERRAFARAARVAAFNSVIAALKPLVATLSAEQKRRIPAFLDMTERAGGPQPMLERWMFAPEREQCAKARGLAAIRVRRACEY